jgi:Tfp pilus assembly protein FimT
LVIVLAVMALLWGIAAPRYAGAMFRYRAEASARRIAADLTMARAHAMQTSSSVAVTFDTTNNKYTLAGIQSLDRLSSNCTVNLAIDPYQATLTTVPFASNKVTFSTYGSADQGGTITVTSGGFAWTVTLEATSGKVTVSGP